MSFRKSGVTPVAGLTLGAQIMEYFIMIGFMASVGLVFWFVNVASTLDSIDKSLKELVERGRD